MNDDNNVQKEKKVYKNTNRSRHLNSSIKNYASDNEEWNIKMLEIQENERNRIASDIHDSIVQNLISVVHKAELSMKLVDVDGVKTKLELQTMILTIKNSIDDMRNIIFDLKPMMIDDIGLVATVERHINRIKMKENIKVELIVKNDEYDILPIVNLTLFRIIQEACNNVIKHAKATKIIVTISYNKEHVEVTVEDDGIGFDIKNILKNNGQRDDLSGLGISIMKERVYLMSGKIEFINKVESGTKVLVKVPILKNI